MCTIADTYRLLLERCFIGADYLPSAYQSNFWGEAARQPGLTAETLTEKQERGEGLTIGGLGRKSA